MRAPVHFYFNFFLIVTETEWLLLSILKFIDSFPTIFNLPVSLSSDFFFSFQILYFSILYFLFGSFFLEFLFLCWNSLWCIVIFFFTFLYSYNSALKSCLLIPISWSKFYWSPFSWEWVSFPCFLLIILFFTLNLVKHKLHFSEEYWCLFVCFSKKASS